jgi:hypothetical protein
MHKNNLHFVFIILFLVSTAYAQVIMPVEIKDPELRVLEQQYMDDLKTAAQDILANHFEYPFYLSRKLDLDEAQEKGANQSSIRFDRYNGKVVIATTGNYFAAYSADKVNKDQRARETFLKVVLPILKAEVPPFQSNPKVQGYAIEISHHIVGKVMGVAVERPENIMVYLPQTAAIRLLGAKEDSTKQAALLQGQIFLNAEPVTVWLNGAGPQLAANVPPADLPNAAQVTPAATIEVVDRPKDEVLQASLVPATLPGAKTKEPTPPVPAPRDTSAVALATLQGANQEVIAQIVKELDAQAHFVNYAAPSFVAFRQGAYLELSLNTNLPESAAGSRYKIAAMAFDDHIAHLIRPLVAHFKDDQQFDGIGFSTTVHIPGKTAATSTSQAVEFFFPLAALHCYERYDCTGQQLIEAGSVLINGERVGLDLQIAEANLGR